MTNKYDTYGKISIEGEMHNWYIYADSKIVTGYLYIHYIKQINLKSKDNLTEFYKIGKDDSKINSIFKNLDVNWLKDDELEEIKKIQMKQIEVIPVKVYGKIESSDKYNKWYVYLDQNSAGFYVYIQKLLDLKNGTNEIYDYFFNKIPDAELFILQQEWEIEWLN